MDGKEEKERPPWMESAIEIRDKALKWANRILPHVARLCLIGTFLDDGLRMLFQWSVQQGYMERTWGVHWFIAAVVVFINMSGQLVACGLILARRHVSIACGILYGLILLQIFIYKLAYVTTFLLKNLALVGAVTVLLAEAQPKARDILTTQLPSTGNNSLSRTVLQLSGRILLLLMFVTHINFELSYPRMIETVVGSLLLILVLLGYKTKEAGLTLALWLLLLNIYLNAWWTDDPDANYETLRFNFFQTLSVIGGLLMVVAVGPGDYSVDELKKFE